jgi:hypothetical protein
MDAFKGHRVIGTSRGERRSSPLSAADRSFVKGIQNMKSRKFTPPAAWLIHDSEQSAYDAALSEGWPLTPQKTRRKNPTPDSQEPHSACLRHPHFTWNTVQPLRVRS